MRRPMRRLKNTSSSRIVGKIVGLSSLFGSDRLYSFRGFIPFWILGISMVKL